jgi:hypothetical protein
MKKYNWIILPFKKKKNEQLDPNTLEQWCNILELEGRVD